MWPDAKGLSCGKSTGIYEQTPRGVGVPQMQYPRYSRIWGLSVAARFWEHTRQRHCDYVKLGDRTDLTPTRTAKACQCLGCAR